MVLIIVSLRGGNEPGEIQEIDKSKKSIIVNTSLMDDTFV